MAEHEELKLTVNLEDKASAKLAKLRDEMENLHRGSTGQSLEKVNRYTRDFSTGLKKVTESTIDVTKAMGPAGLAIGGVATAVVAAGIAFYNVGKQLQVFSQASLSLAAMANTLGILPGQFKSLSQQLATVMSTDQAQQNVLEFGKTMQEYGRMNSQAKAEWIRQAGFQPEAIQLIEAVTGLSNKGMIDQAMQTYIDAVNAAYEKNVGDIGPVQAALQRRKGLELAGLSVDVTLLKDKLHAASDKEIADAQQQVSLARDFNIEWNKTLKQIEDFGTAFQLHIIGPFTELNKSINDVGIAWGNVLGEEIKTDIRDAKALYDIMNKVAGLLHKETPEERAAAYRGVRRRNWGKAAGRALTVPSGWIGSRQSPYPGLQHGGIVTRPTVAMIGEAGPEAVVPLRGGYANFPRSQNIEDRRQKTLEENTEQLKALNTKLEGGGSGGGPGGGNRYGMLSTGSYGTGPGSGPSTGPSTGPQSNTGPTRPPALAVPSAEGGGVQYGAGESPALGTPKAASATTAAGPGYGASGPTTATGGGTRGRTSIAELEHDPAAQAAIARFAEKFPNVPNPKTQIYSLVRGESGLGVNMTQRNEYAGYFALGKNEAYGQMGLTKQQFAALPFDQQMDAYTKWMLKNDPSGTKVTNLGLFNAASDVSLQTKPGDTEVYSQTKGGPIRFAAMRQNAKTWGAASGQAGGPITIAGIEKYYGRNDADTNRQIAAAGVAQTPGATAQQVFSLPPEKGPYYGQSSGYGETYGVGSTAAAAAAGGPTSSTYTGDTKEVAAARAYLVATASGGSTATAQGGMQYSVARLHPEFALRLAAGVKALRDAGYSNAGINSAFRTGSGRTGTGSRFDVAGESTHSIGAGVDLEPTSLGGAGSAKAARAHQILAGVGIYGPYGPNNRAEFNHFQLVPQKVVPGAPALVQRLGVSGSHVPTSDELVQLWSATGVKFPTESKELDKSLAAETSKQKVSGSGDIKVTVPPDTGKKKSPVFKDVVVDRPVQMKKTEEGAKFGEASLNSSGAV